jgi:hypothetical protein
VLTNIQKIADRGGIGQINRPSTKTPAGWSWWMWTATGSWCGWEVPVPRAKSPVTLKHYVENKLPELVSPELVVEEVQ